MHLALYDHVRRCWRRRSSLCERRVEHLLRAPNKNMRQTSKHPGASILISRSIQHIQQHKSCCWLLFNARALEQNTPHQQPQNEQMIARLSAVRCMDFVLCTRRDIAKEANNIREYRAYTIKLAGFSRFLSLRLLMLLW